MKTIFIKISITFLLASGSLIYSQTLKWQVISQMPFPVSDGQAIVKDSVIYILGGFSDSLGIPVNLIQEYNPSTNRWRLVGHMRFSRRAFIAQKFNDSVIICGGTFRGPISSNYLTMEMWNLNSNPYIFSSNENFNRIFVNGVVVGGKVYLIGGTKNHLHISPHFLPYIVEYDIRKDSITYKFDSVFTNIQLPIQQAVALLGNDIFIFGGVSFGVNSRIFRFNIINKKFSQVSTSLLRARAGSAAVKYNDEEIMIIGGYNEMSHATASTEIFSVSSGTASVRFGPIMNLARRNPMAVKLGNSIYVFGGEGITRRDIAQVERLDLITNVKDEEPIPNNFILHQNFPNPFNPSTVISYQLSAVSYVTLKVYDILGKEIETLVDEVLEPGIHHSTFHIPHSAFTSGVYFYQLRAGSHVGTKKMVLLK